MTGKELQDWLRVRIDNDGYVTEASIEGCTFTGEPPDGVWYRHVTVQEKKRVLFFTVRVNITVVFLVGIPIRDCWIYKNVFGQQV